ncbi:hypothetical protein [Algoriphagus mannitolivorans]|uniref:hypothetical protein n=1 Tax=Algoriphagus mannitolivorans TaxID=226504 RepID=UPI000422A535|nr:hypothetical protein [Algoriphagus mannitolivorans]
MKIREFKLSSDFSGKSQKLELAVLKFNSLIKAANQHQLPDGLADEFNQKIEKLGYISSPSDLLVKSLTKLQNTLVVSLRDMAKLVTKNYYRNLWMGVGMAVFGVPFGVVFSSLIKNYAFIGIGIPMGLSIGIGVGTALDNQAKKEGRLLDF